MRLGWRLGMWLVLAAALPFAAARADDSGTRYGYPVIEIWKAQRRMELRNGSGEVERKFWVALGQDPSEPKRRQGDSRTPVGRYFVSEKNGNSRFRRFLGLSYPNIEDAERGYWDHLINTSQWADIYFANLRGEAPPWGTRLGGRVGIHGYGGRPEIPVDWTEGCIAVPDADIDYIFSRVPVGTPVLIHDQ